MIHSGMQRASGGEQAQPVRTEDAPAKELRFVRISRVEQAAPFEVDVCKDGPGNRRSVHGAANRAVGEWTMQFHRPACPVNWGFPSKRIAQFRYRLRGADCPEGVQG